MNVNNRNSKISLTLGRTHIRWSFFVLLLFLVPQFSFAQQEEAPAIRLVKNPDQAPDFQLTTIDGKPISLASLRGKVILLNFWATWCGPCRAEVPDLVELQNKYRDKLQVLGLVTDDDDESAVKKFVNSFGINYPVAMATPDIRMQYGGIPALPTSFVIDLEGRVVQKHEGLRDPVLYETEVRALLGMPIKAKVETFEDTGEIFLKHADRASTLPGVDLTKLTPEQKNVVLHKFNAESCTCGCQFTLAQCRIWDRGCAVSLAATKKIISEISPPTGQTGSSAGKPATAKPTVPDSKK